MLEASKSTSTDSQHRGSKQPLDSGNMHPDMLDTRSTLSHRQVTNDRRSARQPKETNNAPEKATPTHQAKYVREPSTGQWIDKDYYKTNPWYNQEKKKPIFSLGKPLPRMVRWDGSQYREEEVRPNNDLAELGEVYSENSSEPGDKAKAEKRGNTHRQTPAGVSQGERFNDAGQPVFDYTPSNDKQEGQQDSGTEEQQADSPDFGIDSEPLGKRETDAAKEPDSNPDDYRNWWARIRAKHPEPLAEFLATFAAAFLGLASSLSVNLSANQAQQYGTYETSCWAWGFAWMFGIYLGGGVSGAHMNPAISISLSLFRGFPWRRCGIYVLAQFLASFAAGALAYGVYKDTIHHLDPTMENTAKVLFSTPNAWVSIGTACFNQMVGSAVMMVAVFALGDDQNNPPGAGMHAFILGLLVTTLRFALGYNIGSAFNPASDFGPRVIAYAFGYREKTVFATGWWFYGPWLSTLAGSFIGCSVYDSFIFVGSESPINYRVPEKYRKRIQRMVNLDK
ncbi:aquaporin-like protein [Xylaria sp. FL0933]|nr:aquaporin-like protein [Xylaria sp. FL0933]